MKNKEKSTVCLNNKTGVLARDTFIFKNVFEHEKWNVDYIYEVELISLTDLIGKHSVIHTSSFKDFYNNELDRKKNKNFDENINIRDLYPIDIHLKDCNKNDLKRFNRLNEILLSNDKISRRVTKKEIVYKKNKSRSIISFKIKKLGGINIFLFKDVEKIDAFKKFITISKKNCKPLEKFFCIENDDDLKYVELIIDKYLEKILK